MITKHFSCSIWLMHITLYLGTAYAKRLMTYLFWSLTVVNYLYWCLWQIHIKFVWSSGYDLFVPIVRIFHQHNLLSSPVVTQLQAFIYPGIVLSMLMLSFIFVIACGLFVWTRVCVGLFIYLLSLEIQLSKGNGSDSINWSSLAIFWIWIANVKWQSFSKRWS